MRDQRRRRRSRWKNALASPLPERTIARPRHIPAPANPRPPVPPIHGFTYPRVLAPRSTVVAWPQNSARAGSGIGLRSPHLGEIMAGRPPVGFLEVHAENYMTGAPVVGALEDLRRDYPISFHGVGLSLGSAGDLDAGHLTRFKALVDRF